MGHGTVAERRSSENIRFGLMEAENRKNELAISITGIVHDMRHWAKKSVRNLLLKGTRRSRGEASGGRFELAPADRFCRNVGGRGRDTGTIGLGVPIMAQGARTRTGLERCGGWLWGNAGTTLTARGWLGFGQWLGGRSWSGIIMTVVDHGGGKRTLEKQVRRKGMCWATQKGGLSGENVNEAKNEGTDPEKGPSRG